MAPWSGLHRAFAVESYLNHDNSYRLAERAFCNRFNIYRLCDAPSCNLIKLWVKKFRLTGTTTNNTTRPREKVKRSAENIAITAAAVQNHPRRSIRKLAASLNLHRSTVHRIMRLDLKVHPYKIRIIQKIKQEDYVNRKKYCEHMLENFSLENDMDKVLFSDEAHFHLEGYVNRQNCRYWAPNNPKEKHQNRN